MKKPLILLLLSIGSVQAAPVILTKEVVAHYYDTVYADGMPLEFINSTVNACTTMLLQNCNNRWQHEWEVRYTNTQTVGWNYESTVLTSSSSFLLEASDYVYARAVYKDINDSALSYAGQKGYLVEFLVSEEVLYTGNRMLTDAVFDYEGGDPFPMFGEGGSIYESGAVLQPGLYQFWSASGGTGGGRAEGLASALAIAEFGEVVQVNDREDFRFKFTSAVVPIPAAVWLFGSGLALLGWIRRKPA